MQVIDVQVPTINYFWDIIKYNASQIEKDFKSFVKEGSIHGKLDEGVYLINEDRIFIGKDSRVKPCCVLDAENGPIFYGHNVTIAPNTTIEDLFILVIILLFNLIQRYVAAQILERFAR